MKFTRIFTPAAAIVALALSGVPAQAQHRGGGGGGHASAAPRGGGARTGSARQGVAGGGSAVPRGGAGPYNRAGNGAYSYRGYGYRGYGYRGYGYGGYGYRGYGFGYTLAAPYYAFRPRVGLGFGLYLGYPVAYPYWAFPSPYVYGYPYPPAYAYPPAYGYAYPGAPGSSAPNPYPAYGGAPAADPNSVTAAPETSAPRQGQPPASGQYGGLSFQMTPDTAQIYVDGVYVGIANQFSATAQPLTLTPGAHHVEVRADGYQSMVFNVNVAPGQVIPYQGTMQR
jgi:hypothetical protein